MANLYYYDRNGNRVGPVTSAALQALAQRGLVTPTTTLENDKGQTILAKKLPGLTFPGSASTGASPFAAPMPETYQAVPHSVPVPHTTGFWATMVSTMKATMHFIASAVGFILVLLLAGAVVWVLWWLWCVTNASSNVEQAADITPMTPEEQQMQCSNNIKRIGLAIHTYTDMTSQAYLPSLYTVDKDGKPLHSWRVSILREIGEAALYAKIRLDEPWDSKHNRQFHNQMPAVYQCPSNPKKGCCYSVIAGEGFVPAPANRNMDSLRDGTGNTLAIVEVKQPFCWMDPTADVTLDELVKGINRGRVGSFHFGGCNVGMFDGRVQFVFDTIDTSILRALGTGRGNERINLPW